MLVGEVSLCVESLVEDSDEASNGLVELDDESSGLVELDDESKGLVELDDESNGEVADDGVESDELESDDDESLLVLLDELLSSPLDEDVELVEVLPRGDVDEELVEVIDSEETEL